MTIWILALLCVGLASYAGFARGIIRAAMSLLGILLGLLLAPLLGPLLVPVVVAVSCNPNSFGRDAKILMESGYRLTTLWPVAQFRWSSHVELVARFERQA